MSEIKRQREREKGMSECDKERTKERGKKNPHLQPQFSMKSPKNICLKPLPNEPIPSMIPVIVDVARELCLRPRSAVAVVTI